MEINKPYSVNNSIASTRRELERGCSHGCVVIGEGGTALN